MMIAYQGYGSAKITKILREEKVPTASWLNFTRYGTFAHIFEGKAGNAERIREKKKKASALKKAENRQNEIDRLFTKMYEDRACEKITERNFIMLSGKYQKEQIELEQQITNLREELSKMEQDMIGAEKWIELIKEYSVPKELTAPLLNAMIEKILIHEATTNEDNERIQEIEIYYRFIGKVD